MALNTAHLPFVAAASLMITPCCHVCPRNHLYLGSLGHAMDVQAMRELQVRRGEEKRLSLCLVDAGGGVGGGLARALLCRCDVGASRAVQGRLLPPLLCLDATLPP